MKSTKEKKFTKLKKKYKGVDEKEIAVLSKKHAEVVKRIMDGESPTANNISALLEAEFTTRELCILGSLFTVMLCQGKINTNTKPKSSDMAYN